MRDINTIIIHCAYTPPTSDVGVSEMRNWHLQRGWSDVGYHYVIRRDGTLEEGRPIEEPGAHAKGHNADSIGVCLVGGMSKSGDAAFNFTRSQMAGLEALIEYLTTRYDISEVIGHNQVSDKTCPCFDVVAWWGGGK